MEAESALKRPVSGAVALEVGPFYDGTRTDYEGQVSWRPSRYFTGELAYEQNRVNLPDGDFVTHLGSARLDAAFSPDLTWSNFLQFDNESDTLGWNTRLQWILEPDEDRDLVYHITMPRAGDAATLVSPAAAWTLQYTIRFCRLDAAAMRLHLLPLFVALSAQEARSSASGPLAPGPV